MSIFVPRKVKAEAELKCDKGTTPNVNVVIHSQSMPESARSTSSAVAKDKNSSQEAECSVPLKAECADAKLIFLNYVGLWKVSKGSLNNVIDHWIKNGVRELQRCNKDLYERRNVVKKARRL